MYLKAKSKLFQRGKRELEATLILDARSIQAAGLAVSPTAVLLELTEVIFLENALLVVRVRGQSEQG